MQHAVTFVLDGKAVTIDFRNSHLTPTTTLLQYLRTLPQHRGVKEGCAEGDCGACTVVLAEPAGDGRLRYYSVDSCLLFLPMLHGKQVITVENLRAPDGTLHPVQKSMVDLYGSQCGFCTPGIAMSLFELYKNSNGKPDREEVENHLSGNLCRCTGYEPIVRAALQACANGGVDHFTYDEQHVHDMLISIPNLSIELTSPDQSYFRPSSVSHTLDLLHAHPDALIIAGGTDVALKITKKHEVLSKIVDISGVRELREVRPDDDLLTIGACCTLSEAASIAGGCLPPLARMLRRFGSMQIRNVATIGGSIGTASPISDLLPVLMAYRASVILLSQDAERTVPVEEFVTGYRKTLRRPGELIAAVVIPGTTGGVVMRSYKVSKRKELDIATVSACFRLELDDGIVSDIVLAYGGMSAWTRRAVQTESALLGKPWQRDVVDDASQLLRNEFAPISDARSGAEARNLMARNLLRLFYHETRNRDVDIRRPS
jgi:xanthine dehydrogenase small subunit